MIDISSLMAVKVLAIVGLGAVFVWWQLRDLANEKKRAAKRDAYPDSDHEPNRDSDNNQR